MKDCIEVRFESREAGTSPVVIVLGRWKRDRSGQPATDGYLALDGAMIPRAARMSVVLRPMPWNRGTGLNVEWVVLRWQ